MDAIKQFDGLVEGNKFVMFIFYRGNWCPFCMSYLKQAQGLVQGIERSGGRIVAVTAETEENVEATRKASGFKEQIISDPHNHLAKELKKRGLLNVAITKKAGYEYGLAQPAILALTAEKTLYKWEIIPSMMNFGGAKDRPDLQQVCDSIASQVKGGQAKPINEKSFGLLSMCAQKVY